MTSGVQGLRVLVVEDVFLIAESLGELLQHYGCYVVGPVATLEQSLDVARDTPLDGAILDVNLEGKLCFPVAAMLAQRGIPFFFVTGYGNEIFPPNYLGIPRLTKPFEAADLEEMVAREFSKAA